MEGQNPFPCGLGDVDEPTASYPFAQQQEEGRRRLHATTGLLGYQKHPGMLSVGRDEKLKTLAGKQLQGDRTLVREDDALNPRPKQTVELVAKAG